MITRRKFHVKVFYAPKQQKFVARADECITGLRFGDFFIKRITFAGPPTEIRKTLEGYGDVESIQWIK